MMRYIIAITASIILALGAFSPAQATAVSGTQAAKDNGCFVVWQQFVQLDCSYTSSYWFAGIPFPGPWVGPISLWEYRAPGGGLEGDPTRLAMNGDITVNGSGATATVDGTLNLAAGERVFSCGQGGATCLESWDGITHTLANATVDRAAPNGIGGYTYEVAANAFPIPLDPCIPFFPFLCADGWNFSGQVYPSVTPSPSFPAPGSAWLAPAPNGTGPASFDVNPFFPPGLGFPGSGFNTGTTSSAVTSNYQCVVVIPGADGDCDNTAAIGGPSADADYENILLKLDTGATGELVSATMSMTQQYVVVFPFLGDSWAGNWVEFSTVVAVAKPGSDPDIQIDKRNILPVVIYGNAGTDVTMLDIGSLELRGLSAIPGAYESHGQEHISDKDGDGFADITAHFASNEASLQCGINTATLSGTLAGVPFVASVDYNGIGKACD